MWEKGYTFSLLNLQEGLMFMSEIVSQTPLESFSNDFKSFYLLRLLMRWKFIPTDITTKNLLIQAKWLIIDEWWSTKIKRIVIFVFT